MSKAFSNLFRFGRTPQPSNGDNNNVPARRSTSSAQNCEPRNEAHRSASRHRTNSERTRPPLVEDETDADEIIYPRQRAGRSRPSQFIGWQQYPAPESITLPPTRPSTARPSLDIPERGTFQDRPHTPATSQMRRRGTTNEFPMSDSEASARPRSGRPELRSPSRVEDRRHLRQYSTGASIPPVPSLPAPFQSGLRDLSQVVTTSNKYPSAHGGSSDVWKGSWRSDNGFLEVAVKVVRVPVDNPEMKSMMDNRLRQALSIWQSLDSIPLYGVSESFGPFTSLVTPRMGHRTLTTYPEGVGQNLSLAGRFRNLINVAAGLSYIRSWRGGGTLTTYREGAGPNPNGAPPTDVVIPKSPSRAPFASTFISLCRILAAHPAMVQLCAWSSFIGLAQAASVDQSLQIPVPQNKGRKVLLVLLLVLFLLLFVMSLVVVWWARRRAAHRAAQRGRPAPRMPSRPMSTPPPVYLRLTRSESLSATSRARRTIFDMADRLSAAPDVTQRSWQEWSRPEIILTGVGLLIAFITLVLGGVTLLYTKRQLSRS